MSTKLYDWNKAIDEIDLIDYFKHKFPSFYWDNSRKAFIDNPDPSLRSNKFVFFKGKDGKQNYISRNTGNGGNLIHFIKNEIANRNTNWATTVNEELSNFYPLLAEIKKNITKNEYDIRQVFNNHISSEFQLTGKLLPLHEKQKDFITGHREISLTTINSPEFRNAVKTYQPFNQKYFCIGVPLVNIEESIVGVNKIFTYEKSDFFNEKRFEPGSDNRNGFSKSNKLDSTDTFIISEGIWDGMAHFEIYKPKNSEYLFSNGELGINKANAMLKYIDKREVKNIVLANDNDMKGNYFNLLILSQIIPNLKLKGATDKMISLSIVEGDKVNISKVNEMCNHFLNKNNELVQAIAENKGGKNLLEVSDLFIYSRKGATNEIEITLPLQKDFIEEFNNFLPEMFAEQEIKYKISKATTKDFNDDLKLIKSQKKNFEKEIYLQNTKDELTR